MRAVVGVDINERQRRAVVQHQRYVRDELARPLFAIHEGLQLSKTHPQKTWISAMASRT